MIAKNNSSFRRKRFVLLCVFFIFLLQHSSSFAITGGEATLDYPQVGALLDVSTEMSEVICSGTLIDSKTFLTAAHCVCGIVGPTVGDCNLVKDESRVCEECKPDRNSFKVFFQGVGVKKIKEIKVAPEFNVNPSFERGSDYALLILEDKIDGITPAKLPVKNYYNTDEEIFIAGFGAIKEFNGDVSTDASYGIKRYGKNIITGCSNNGDSYYEESLCIKKENDSLSCSIDSGGPLFIPINDTIEILGVGRGPIPTSVLMCEDSESTMLAASVFYYSYRISDELADYEDDFSLLSVRQYSGAFEEYKKNDFYLPRGVKRLSFTINGTDNDIEARNNYSASLTGPDGNISPLLRPRGVFQSCIVENPQEGTWGANIEKVEGNGGEIQLLVTALVDKSLANSLQLECSFLDIPAYSPYHDAVKKICELGVMSGKSDIMFEPDKLVTRAEFSKILVVIAGETGVRFDDQEINIFPDVSTGSEYEQYIKKIANKPVIIKNKRYGYIIEGYPEGNFKPDSFISMPEMIKMVLQTFSPVTPNSQSWNFPLYRWYTPFLNGAESFPIAPIFDGENFTPVMADKDKYHLRTKDGDVRFVTRKEAAKALYDAYIKRIK